jgi:hypothetical protein
MASKDLEGVSHDLVQGTVPPGVTGKTIEMLSEDCG